MLDNLLNQLYPIVDLSPEYVNMLDSLRLRGEERFSPIGEQGGWGVALQEVDGYFEGPSTRRVDILDLSHPVCHG